MFKNFFRKVRATLKNSGEAIAGIAGIAAGLPMFGNLNPMAQLAIKYLPNLITSQYQDNPLKSMLANQAITTAATAGTNFLRPNVDPAAINRGTAASSFDAPGNEVAASVMDDANLATGKTMQGLQKLNQLTKEKTGSKFGLPDFFTGLYNDEGLTGKGKLLGSIASTLGPGLATYLALIGEDPPETMDPKEYRSAVDDYYSAKARGENPNPADYGLAPTPAEDMVGDLRYEGGEDYTDVAPSRYGLASGGIPGLSDGTLPFELDPREELMSVLNVRNRATESRMPVGLSAMPLDQMSEEVLTAKTGGVVGLALGGLEKRGMVYGPGGPKDDKIPAMLSNGEFVMTAEAVDNAGGPAAMYNLMNRLDPDSSKGPIV
tara:strand:- start:354 stop:1481 length:1128 start_codon:yes stop_codon:yes gene_type:complete